MGLRLISFFSFLLAAFIVATGVTAQVTSLQIGHNGFFDLSFLL
jgi:hypothetical protein